MTDDKNNMRIGLADQALTAPDSGGHSRLDDRGYIMAVLLIGMAISAVWLTASLPAWRQQAQREKELELVFRGEQYGRAIALYYVKNRTLPVDLDVLVSQKYLRKKWKDPVTGDDFTPLLAGQTAQGGGSPQTSGRPGGPGSTSAPQQQNLGSGRGPVQGPTGATGLTGSGGILGVVSKSKGTSIKVYQGQQEYDLWQFTYQSACQKMGGACNPPQQGQPQGGNPAGGPAGRGGPAGGPAGRGGPTGGPIGRGGPTGGGPVGGGPVGRGRGGL